MNDMAEPVNAMETRKQKEIEWSDFRRTISEDDAENYQKYNANHRFYAINRKVNHRIDAWLAAHTQGKDVFEVACGEQPLIGKVARQIRSGVAADIAPLTIELAKKNAQASPDLQKIDYRVLDCEHTGLPDSSFDVMIETGALHHMDLDAAYKEAVRLLRKDGQYFCIEAIRHNPIIHLYRRLTPHLRTAWEVDHILGRAQVMHGLRYFEQIEVDHYNIATLFAIPLIGTRLFAPALAVCEAIDSVLTRLPGIRWIAWQAVFVLKYPRK